MSAILGRIEFSGQPVNEIDFAGARQALAHYGPDGSGALVEGPAGFAHHHLMVSRRTAEEAQPARLGNLIIVADAILDNREDLARTLRLEPSETEALPDSAMILRAFRKWGENCTSHLIGDFAFAIFNTEKRSLFLARDHIGARPLYWFQRQNTFLFATDIRGLVAFPDIGWKIDENMVARYLANPSKPLPKCFFEGMYFLQPGSQLTVGVSGVAHRRWWDPHNLPDIRYKKQEDYVARFRELTEQAVNCRVDTDARVGSHISGGIDSTAVTVLAARAVKKNGQNLTAAYPWAPSVSQNFPDMGPRDERRIIDEICAREGINCRFGAGELLNNTAFVELPLELNGTADLIDELPVIDKAANDGVRVMLSGWGGDEAFSAQGRGYLSYLITRGRLVRAFNVNRTYAGGLSQTKNLVSSVWKNGVVPMLPGKLFEAFSPFDRIFQRHCYASKELQFRHKVEIVDAKRDIRPKTNPTKYLSELILRGHIAARMDTWTAWSAHARIQYRYPLTDRQLMEFVLGIPPEQLFGMGQRRFLANTALKRLLPQKLSKNDIANEEYRSATRRSGLSILTSVAAVGKIETNCDWLDMPGLRNSFLVSASSPEKNEVIEFAEICGALRIWYLCQRSKT